MISFTYSISPISKYTFFLQHFSSYHNYSDGECLRTKQVSVFLINLLKISDYFKYEPSHIFSLGNQVENQLSFLSQIDIDKNDYVLEALVKRD